MNKLKKALLIGTLGSTLLVSGIVNAASTMPLWYANYLKGISTPAYSSGTGNNTPTTPAQPSAPSQPQTPSEPSTPTSPTDPRQPMPPSSWQNPSAPTTPTAPASSQASVKSEEQTLFNLLNQERVNRGLAPLKWNDQLTGLAELKAQDMAVNNYFDHTSPTYGKAVDMVRKAGIPQWICGENIASTYSAQRANELFMGSSIHRSAMLNKNFTEVGIGMYRKSNGTLYISEIFIGTR